VIQPASTKAHGWREVMVEDPDGYLWAVGVPVDEPAIAAAGRSCRRRRRRPGRAARGNLAVHRQVDVADVLAERRGGLAATISVMTWAFSVSRATPR